MTQLDPLLLAGAKSKGKRPYFLADRQTEQVLSIVMAVAQELAVMRERMDTVERLLAAKGVVTAADIEGFTPTRAEAEARGRWTQEYLARILRILQQEQEALSDSDDQSSETVSEELAHS
jgi:hypothetical protein